MTYKEIILIGIFLSSIWIYGCATVAPDTGVTGRNINCDGETRMLVDCRRTYKQYTRNMRVDIAKIKKHAYGAGIGAKQLIQLDTVSGDLMAQQRQICIDYNNCILTKEEYKTEAAFLRRAQMKIRHAAAQLTGGPAGMGDPYGGDVSGSGGVGGGSSQPPQAPAAFNQLMSGIISGLSTDSGGNSGAAGTYGSDPYGSGSYESESSETGIYDAGTYDEGAYEETVYEEGSYEDATEYEEVPYEEGIE